MKQMWWMVAGGALLLNGCTTIDLHSSHQLEENQLYQKTAENPALTQAQNALFSHQALPDHWWQLYNDATLNGFVEQALKHNTDLRVALANLEQAQAKVDEAAGGKQPSLSVNGGPSYGHSSGLSLLEPGVTPPNDYHYSAGVNLSYQVDLFGQIQRGIDAAKANSEAAQAAVDLAKINVVASTTRAYASVCSANMELATANQSLSLQKRALQVNQTLAQAGRIGQIDVDRAFSQYNQLQATIPPLLAERQSALFQLATLTGQLPAQLSANTVTCQAPPTLQNIIPVGDGVQLLRRRPDIRQAERLLVASGANIDVITADLYPKITLGLSATSMGLTSGIGNGDTFAWSAGPLISWTIPNTGVVQARIAQAKAAEKMAYAKFDGTILTALRETETALSNYAQALDRNKALTNARNHAAIVAQQARILYQNGKTNYLDNLDAERSLATTESTLAASSAALMQDQIALFLALGGGWQQ